MDLLYSSRRQNIILVTYYYGTNHLTHNRQRRNLEADQDEGR